MAYWYDDDIDGDPFADDDYENDFLEVEDYESEDLWQDDDDFEGEDAMTEAALLLGSSSWVWRSVPMKEVEQHEGSDDTDSDADYSPSPDVTVRSKKADVTHVWRKFQETVISLASNCRNPDALRKYVFILKEMVELMRLHTLKCHAMPIPGWFYAGPVRTGSGEIWCGSVDQMGDLEVLYMSPGGRKKWKLEGQQAQMLGDERRPIHIRTNRGVLYLVEDVGGVICFGNTMGELTTKRKSSLVRALEGHEGRVVSLLWQEEGSDVLWSASEDGAVRKWENGRCTAAFHTGPQLRCLAFDAEQCILWVGGVAYVEGWRVRKSSHSPATPPANASHTPSSRQPLQQLQEPTSPISRVVQIRTGGSSVAVAGDGTLWTKGKDTRQPGQWIRAIRAWRLGKCVAEIRDESVCYNKFPLAIDSHNRLWAASIRGLRVYHDEEQWPAAMADDEDADGKEGKLPLEGEKVEN